MNQWRKGIASWTVGKTLYLSVPFTWLLGEAEFMARQHKGRVVAGGPAVKLLGAPWADETPDACPYDTLAFHNPLATFTTRGCPNKCTFCAVPKIEGAFRELSTWKPAPVVCDNNLLACSREHFGNVVDSLRPFPYADFNQGLDALRFTGWHAEQLATLKHVKIRFAFDTHGSEFVVHRAVEIARVHGLKDIGIYCLIGFNDDPEEAQHRLETVRSWGIFPNPMRYQPLDAIAKNAFVAPGWTERELRKMMKYYSRLGWLGNVCTYEDYDYLKHDTRQEGLF